MATLAGSAVAKDLGVQGSVWPILERDMREFVVEAASKTDWDAIHEQRKESARTYADRLPKRVWPKVEGTETFWMDPSIELATDIQAPVKGPDGKLVWEVLFTKGTRVNPLTKVRPSVAQLFFDGNDPAQVALVEEVLKAEPLRVVPIEAGQGSVLESRKRFNRPVFHATDEAVQRFQLRGLPTLVYTGFGARALYMGITQYAAPYSATAVLSTWPELRNPATLAKKPGAQ